ncbi:MAG: ABC transporter permease [Patescibacteria group bacterium]|nr:ABC transporter permease [Patescibacteria group bacterium]
MLIKYSVKTALTGLITNKSRSILTILGIVIAIAAIVLIVSIGQGAKDLILQQIQGLGSKTIVVIPGREPEGPSDFVNVFLDSLKEKDYKLLKNKNNVPGAEDIMPLVISSVKLSYFDETYQATILGGGDDEINNLMARIFDIFPDRGSFFTPQDVSSRASVIVIGDNVREELFGESINPLGEKIKINGRNFRVIGILPSKGQVSFFNFDDMVLAPYTTAQQYILGRKYFDRIIVVAKSEKVIARTVSDIEITLRSSHGITDPDKDDFFVETQADLVERVGFITNILTLFLVTIAAISLLVGGIGIMNIMLVSVTERTKEIGLRKAVGATNKDILRQFLLESVLLTAIGGIVGIALGVALSFVVSLILTYSLGLNWEFTFPLSAAALGLGVSAAVGLVFGIYPARQAAKKTPIDALRYE